MSNTKVIVHPAAILRISDHSTRAQFLGQEFQYHSGILLGLSEGLKVEIHSAFEVLNEPQGDSLRIRSEPFRVFLRLHQNIYPHEQILGWYVCQNLPDSEIDRLQASFEAESNDLIVRGVFLPDRDPPLSLSIVKGDSWVPVDYTYESELAERIALMEIQSEGTAESQVQFTADAYKSLNEHLGLIEKYLTKVYENEIPFDPLLVKKAADIAQWWKHKTPVESLDRDLEQADLALFAGLMAEKLSAYEDRSRDRRAAIQ